MATVVDGLFDVRVRPGRPSKYPWEEWLDGRWWEIQKGVDFDRSVASMRKSVSTASKRKGGTCVTSTLGDKIRFRFLPISG